MKLGGILQTQNYKHTYATIDRLRLLTDVVIVLDDNSTASEAPSFQKDIDVLIALKHRQLFNCQANKTMLLYQAWVNGCDWVLCLDDDLILSHYLHSRSHIELLIRHGEQNAADIVHVRLRDLWGDYLTYRHDGVWGYKTFPLLQRVWFGDKDLSLLDPKYRRLHYPCFKHEMPTVVSFDHPYAVYHTGNMTLEARQARMKKYKEQDPDMWYAKDYSYITDETGMQLAPVPPEDRWSPPLTIQKSTL